MQNPAESVMDLKELYRRTYKEGDYRTALAVRRELNRVLEVSRTATMTGGKEEAEELNSELEDMIRDVTPTRKGVSR